ncbi:MAG: hypothetical protein Q8K75_06595 [Chlamydiales bacterium]|nr:hypothetical protein [Chlamydiales bacterium]
MISSSINRISEFAKSWSKPKVIEPEVVPPSPVVETVKLIAAVTLGGAVIAGMLYTSGTAIALVGTALAECTSGIVPLAAASEALIVVGNLVAQAGQIIFAPVYVVVYKGPRWFLEKACPYAYMHVREVAVAAGSIALEAFGKLPAIGQTFEYMGSVFTWIYEEVISVVIKMIDHFIQDLLKNMFNATMYLAKNVAGLSTKAWDVTAHIFYHIAIEVIWPSVQNAFGSLGATFAYLGTKAADMQHWVVDSVINPACNKVVQIAQAVYTRIVPGAQETAPVVEEGVQAMASNIFAIA